MYQKLLHIHLNDIVLDLIVYMANVVPLTNYTLHQISIVVLCLLYAFRKLDYQKLDVLLEALFAFDLLQIAFVHRNICKPF